MQAACGHVYILGSLTKGKSMRQCLCDFNPSLSPSSSLTQASGRIAGQAELKSINT